MSAIFNAVFSECIEVSSQISMHLQLHALKLLKEFQSSPNLWPQALNKIKKNANNFCYVDLIVMRLVLIYSLDYSANIDTKISIISISKIKFLKLFF